MFRPAKPETIARRAAERKVERAARRADLDRRLRERAAAARAAGEDNIWTELVDELGEL